MINRRADPQLEWRREALNLIAAYLLGLVITGLAYFVGVGRIGSVLLGLGIAVPLAWWLTFFGRLSTLASLGTQIRNPLNSKRFTVVLWTALIVIAAVLTLTPRLSSLYDSPGRAVIVEPSAVATSSLQEPRPSAVAAVGEDAVTVIVIASEFKPDQAFLSRFARFKFALDLTTFVEGEGIVVDHRPYYSTAELTTRDLIDSAVAQLASTIESALADPNERCTLSNAVCLQLQDFSENVRQLGVGGPGCRTYPRLLPPELADGGGVAVSYGRLAVACWSPSGEVTKCVNYAVRVSSTLVNGTAAAVSSLEVVGPSSGRCDLSQLLEQTRPGALHQGGGRRILTG